MPQVVAFSNVVDSLKAMFLTSHACYELKSYNYGAIIIEFVNCFPTKFNGDVLFKLPLFVIHQDILDNCKVWIESSMVMLGASCKSITLRFRLDWALKQNNAINICFVTMFFVLCFNVF